MATDYTIPKDEYRALMAERDKLLDGFHAMQQLYEDELKHALAENAKLRDLTRHMRDCIGSYGKATGDFGCDSCSRNNDTGECDFDARMRELGVNE